jgi:hypothetical protein
MTKTERTARAFVLRSIKTIGLCGALGLALATINADAATVYQSATYSAQDTGEYILNDNNIMGAVFTLTKTTAITGIGAQFGGFPSGEIFGAIVPVASPADVPAGSSDGLAAISLADVVFAVPQATAIDLIEPLKVTLGPGSYAVVFGTDQFGATGFAGLGFLNDPVGSPTLIRSFFSTGWDSFSDTGVRFVVEGTALPEPMTWAMIVVGFGVLGMVMRSRANMVAA